MIDIDQLDWQKVDGLMPAIIQDRDSGQVLMLGYMNRQALEQTLTSQQITFYSRSKKRLWKKGETSGHTLTLCEIYPDCDCDTLLIQVEPVGPVCHLGTTTCFGQQQELADWQIIPTLCQTITARSQVSPEESYTSSLLTQGNERVAQKVGEEAVEVVIAAMVGQQEAFCNEVADLLFHLLVLLHCHHIEWHTIITCLRQRMKPASRSNSQ